MRWICLVATPHLDRLAAQGVRFTHVFATSPSCGARKSSAFFTGMYQTTIDAHAMRSHRDDDYRLPLGVRPITDRLAMRVLLLEGGDKDVSAESQEIYQGDVLGDPYFPLDVSRLRFLGGTSNHWGGWCRPLDKIDFEGKGPSRVGSWPIKKSDLDPFLSEASDILEIKPYFDERPINLELKQINFEKSPPVRFREKYYQQVLHHRSLFLCLNANAVQLEKYMEKPFHRSWCEVMTVPAISCMRTDTYLPVAELKTAGCCYGAITLLMGAS